MKQRTGQMYHFVVGSISFFLLLNLAILVSPGLMQEFAGINTSALQDSTNVSVGVDANQTTETNVVNQASDIVAVYTNFESQNPIINAIGIVFAAAVIVLLIDIIWLG